MACRGRHLEVVKVLVAARADLNVIGHVGTSAQAIGNSWLSHPAGLSNLSYPPICAQDGFTALLTACCNNYLEVVNLLLAARADKNIKGKVGAYRGIKAYAG